MREPPVEDRRERSTVTVDRTCAPTLAEVLAGLTPLDEDFPAIDDPPTTPEDPL